MQKRVGELERGKARVLQEEKKKKRKKAKKGMEFLFGSMETMVLYGIARICME